MTAALGGLCCCGAAGLAIPVLAVALGNLIRVVGRKR